MPTLPELSMVTKSPAVVEEIAKILPLLGLNRSNSADGVVVPMPTLPLIYVLPLTSNFWTGSVVPMPTFPPNVANPEDLNVVVVALVATRLLIQAVSETVR